MEVQQTLAGLEEEVQTVYQQSRDFMNGLIGVDSSEKYDTFKLLENLSIRFGSESGLTIKGIVDNSLESKLTRTQNSELYKVIKELVANCLKHSGASRMDIQLYRRGGDLAFDMRDNGHGVMKGQGIGLTSMHDRIKSLGGHLSITPSSQGLHIEGSFPLAA